MIAFTICSNNYFAEAITLGHSIIRHGLQSSSFNIFLVDQCHPDINYKNLPFKVIEVDDAIVPDFNRLCTYYNIVELNTAVKPSAFKHLISENPTEKLFAYFDPDIYIYQDVTRWILDEIEANSILITPHVTKPIPLGYNPFESVFLNYGIYNLGFIALNTDDNSKAMLEWWEERTLNLGIDDPSKGLFVDQLWINLVPIFFKGVKISLNEGVNVAYWNINHRSIKTNEGVLEINFNTPLIFFHYSSFDLSLDKLSKRDYTEYSGDKSVLLEMMSNYKDQLLAHGYFFFKKIQPTYRQDIRNFIERKLPNNMGDKKISFLIKYKKYFPKKLLKKIGNLNFIIENIDAYNH
jgi:hypothetical protein